MMIFMQQWGNCGIASQVLKAVYSIWHCVLWFILSQIENCWLFCRDWPWLTGVRQPYTLALHTISKSSLLDKLRKILYFSWESAPIMTHFWPIHHRPSSIRLFSLIFCICTYYAVFVAPMADAPVYYGVAL